MEPLNITKKHLLLLYEDFIFTYKEKPKENIMVLAFQHTNYDVTAINEYALFPSNEICPSHFLIGEDLAIPIVMEFFHEKKHSKKDKKNKRSQSPLYFYKKSTLYKVDKDRVDKRKSDEMKRETDLLLYYFIIQKKFSESIKIQSFIWKYYKKYNYGNSKSLYQEITIKKLLTKIDEMKNLNCIILMKNK